MGTCAEGAERTAFDCGGDDGRGLLRLLDSYVSMFWMQGFAVRNCHEAVQVGISRSGKSGAPVLVKRALATFSHMLFEGNHGDCGTTIHVVDALVSANHAQVDQIPLSRCGFRVFLLICMRNLCVVS